MRSGATVKGALTATLALMAAAALAAPAGPPDALSSAPVPLLVQADPDAAPSPALPDEALPAPLLPAPAIPNEEPLVELPPEGESARPPVASGPGLPVTPVGAVFSFADLAERLLGSVVYISTSQRVTVPRFQPPPGIPDAPDGENLFDEFFDNEDAPNRRGRNVQSLGSGFVIDDTGLIVTNNHVIADAEEIVANFADGRKLTAEVVGIDKKTDLALIRVGAEGELTPVRFGRSEGLRVGDWVLAIGNPFGFGGSVTAGIVSALERDINSGPYDRYIQTDASINRGNSGGPLFNINGEVVGINTAIMSPTGGSIGIGFAVPTEVAVPVIEQLRQNGMVQRGWIGVRIQSVNEDLAEDFGMDSAMGAQVASVVDEGPAAEAGIADGDIVVEFDGKPVAGVRELPRLVANTPPGETVEIVVMRDGERVTLDIDVGLLEDEEAKVAAASTDGEEIETPGEDAAKMLGLSLGELTDALREEFAIGEDVEGVIVEEVAEGSEAAEKGVKKGEVIVQVSRRDVAVPSDVIDRFETLKTEGRRTVMLLLTGEGNDRRFVSLTFEDEDR